MFERTIQFFDVNVRAFVFLVLVRIILVDVFNLLNLLYSLPNALQSLVSTMPLSHASCPQAYGVARGNAC